MRMVAIGAPLKSAGIEGPQRLASRETEEEKPRKYSQGRGECWETGGGSLAPGGTHEPRTEESPSGQPAFSLVAPCRSRTSC